MASEPAEAGSDFVILDCDGLLEYLDDTQSQHDVYQALTGVLRQRLEMKLAATVDGIARLEAVSRQTFMLPPRLRVSSGGAALPIGVDVPDMSA